MTRSSFPFLVLLLVSLVCLVSACPAPKDNPNRFSDAEGAQVFTKKDSNIKVNAGEAFILELDSNPTTGYTWLLQGDAAPAGLELLGCKYTRSHTGSHAIGSGGHDSWAFRAVTSGQVTLNLQHARPWMPRTESADAQFQINVQQTA